jgi:uncharacterized protein DUF4154
MARAAGTIALICVLVVGLGVFRAAADASDDRRALVMLRVLAYDKRLPERAPDAVRILIIHPKTEDGASQAARWSEAFEKAKKLKVDGRSVEVLVHRFVKPGDLERALADLRPAALLACDGLTREIAVAELAKLTRARHVMSIGLREEDVAAGLAVGIVPGQERKRDEIVVNLRAATAEGIKFDAGLLQLARTVGDP